MLNGYLMSLFVWHRPYQLIVIVLFRFTWSHHLSNLISSNSSHRWLLLNLLNTAHTQAAITFFKFTLCCADGVITVSRISLDWFTTSKDTCWVATCSSNFVTTSLIIMYSNLFLKLLDSPRTWHYHLSSFCQVV